MSERSNEEPQAVNNITSFNNGNAVNNVHNNINASIDQSTEVPNFPKLTPNAVKIISGQLNLSLAQLKLIQPIVQVIRLDTSNELPNWFSMTVSDGLQTVLCHLPPSLSDWSVHKLVMQGTYIRLLDFTIKVPKIHDKNVDTLIVIKKADIFANTANAPLMGDANALLTKAEEQRTRKRTYSRLESVSNSEENKNSEDMKDTKDTKDSGNPNKRLKPENPGRTDRSAGSKEANAAKFTVISELNQYKTNFVLTARLLQKSAVIPAANGGSDRCQLYWMDSNRDCISMIQFGTKAKAFVDGLEVGHVYNLTGVNVKPNLQTSNGNNNVNNNNNGNNTSAGNANAKPKMEWQLHGFNFARIAPATNLEEVNSFPFHPCKFTVFSSLPHILAVATEDTMQDETIMEKVRYNNKGNPMVDLIGLILYVHPLMEFGEGKSAKRVITIYDQTEYAIDLTLWGEVAQLYQESYFLNLIGQINDNPLCDGVEQDQDPHTGGLDLTKYNLVFAVQNARLSKYNGGVNASIDNRSIIWVNSNHIDETPELQTWFQEEGQLLVSSNRIQNISHGEGGAMFSNLGRNFGIIGLHDLRKQEIGIGSSLDRLDTFQALANTVLIECALDEGRFPWYDACPDCKKGVQRTEENLDSFTCSNRKCRSYSRLITIPEKKYRANVTALDSTGRAKISMFDKQLQVLLDNVPASVAYTRYQLAGENGSAILTQMFDKVKHSQWIIHGKAKLEQSDNNSNNGNNKSNFPSRNRSQSEEMQTVDDENAPEDKTDESEVRTYRRLWADRVEKYTPQRSEQFIQKELPRLQQRLQDTSV